ncbi:MAG: hypothetical protein KDK71_08075, partial [Chlamydiia bacterium]|nr:hypothetical protein [Chlamydiia bacterium]
MVDSSGSGNLTLTGTGGNGPGGEVGVLANGGFIRFSSGACTIQGTGGTSATLSTSTGGNHGIALINNGSQALNSILGSASLTGIGGTSRGSNHGINIDNAQVRVDQGLTMNRTGTGPASLATEPGSLSNIGVRLNVVFSIFSPGIISITGTGGYSIGGLNHGISAVNSIVTAEATSGVQNLLMGTAHQGSGSDGIFFDNFSFSGSAASIPMQVTAITNSTDTGAEGLSVTNGSNIVIGGVFTVDGTGGAGTNISPGVDVNGSTLTSNSTTTINATSRNTSGSFIAFRGNNATVRTNSAVANLDINAIDGEFLDTGVGTSVYENFGGTVNILTANGANTRGGNIIFQSTPNPSQVKNTSGVVNLTTVGVDKDIIMNTSGEVVTTGGNANLTAVRNIVLGRVDASTGDIVATASGGFVSNGTGTATTPNLTANQATLSAVSGIGSGTSSSVTAIGTQLTRLNSSLSAAGNIVIYEQDALTLGTTTTVNGGFDLNAGGLIDQVGGTVITTAGTNAYAYFTTSRATTLGTASIKNSPASPTTQSFLGQSTVAGDYTFETTGYFVTLDGLIKVGRNFSITTAPAPPPPPPSPVTINVAPEVGGSFTHNASPIPPATGTGNTITAFGTPPNFDISTATLATTGDITINLRNNQDVANPLLLNNAVVLTNNNVMGGQIRVTTVDTFQPPATPTDYNLTQSLPLILQPGQNLIINAARGAASGVISNPVNPLPSPFGGSALNPTTGLGNGSLITLTNPSNSFPGYVRIKDSYTTSIVSSSTPLQLEHVNTYGDFTAAAAPIVVGVNSTALNPRTVRANATLPATATVTLNSGVNTITVLPSGAVPTVSAVTPTGTSNGTVLYTSGSISGDGVTKANNVMVNSIGMIGISTANRLKIDASSIVFSSVNATYMEMLQGVTIAGESSSGPINLLTTVAGNIDVNSVSIGALSKNGLVTAGAGNGITVSTTNGNLTVNQPVTTGAGNGAISLSAIGGLETINQPVSSSGGAITLTGNTGLTHSATGDVSTTGTGTIAAVVSGGDITMVDGTAYTTAGGNISLSSSGNTSLGTLNAGAGDIRSDATGGAITN